MRGRKCSLCGGRLNHNNICTECGLDNTKSDADYHMYQNIADYGELTHTHRSAQTHSWEAKTVQKPERSRTKKAQKNPENRVSSAEARRMMQQAKTSFEQHGQTVTWDREARWRQSARTVKRKRRIARSTAIITIVLLFCGMMPGMLSLFSEMISGDSFGGRETEVEEYEYDPYKYLTEEFREGGEVYSTVLEAGEYIVGVHIPEGKYIVKRKEDYGSIRVRDEVNDLYMSYFLGGEDTGEADDIRLFLGARVSLDTEVEFISENAQTSLMESQENPLTENILLDSEMLTAGESFEPGVYDFVITSGFGSINIEISDEQAGFLDSVYVWLDAENDNKQVYRNVVLPEGTQLTCTEEDMLVTLIPSETIVNTDYISYYTWDYLKQEPLSGLFGEGEDDSVSDVETSGETEIETEE